MDLFSDNVKKFAPLADRVRPTCLEEFIGQEHIIKKGSIIEKAIRNGTLGSCIFYGPPGTGKTSLANIIANYCNAEFRKLNAVSSGVSDVKEIINEDVDIYVIDPKQAEVVYEFFTLMEQVIKNRLCHNKWLIFDEK